jgi:uncharacterized protein (DUF2062 family)
MRNQGFLYKKTVVPIVGLLKQGLSTEKISMGMACGIVLGILPVLGSRTILCAIAAVIFRLNLPAIQLVNYLVYPLQLVLLIPFFHLGNLLFQAEPLPLSAQGVIALLQSDLWGTIRSLWDTTLHAIVAWLLVSPPILLTLHFIFTRLLRRLHFKKRGSRDQLSHFFVTIQ